MPWYWMQAAIILLRESRLQTSEQEPGEGTRSARHTQVQAPANRCGTPTINAGASLHECYRTVAGPFFFSIWLHLDLFLPSPEKREVCLRHRPSSRDGAPLGASADRSSMLEDESGRRASDERPGEGAQSPPAVQRGQQGIMGGERRV